MRPIRCFTCGKLLADKYAAFDERLKKGEDPQKILDDLEIDRYCCRSMMITGVDKTEEIVKFKRQ